MGRYSGAMHLLAEAPHRPRWFEATGGMSQRASMVTALVALATMWWLAPLLGLRQCHPRHSGNCLLRQPDPAHGVCRHPQNSHHGVSLGVIACLGVLLLGTLQGIVVAIIVSLLGLASQTAHPPVCHWRKPGAGVLRPLSPEHPDDETFDGLLILRPEGRLFFINA